jgi:hypothetical protein
MLTVMLAFVVTTSIVVATQVFANEAKQATQSVTKTATQVAKTYYDNTDFRLGEENLSHSEKVGREVWYKATAGNDRFHTYVFQQRIGVLIDWFRVLRSDARGDRFKAWGLMNDPDCCTPGSEGCPAKSMEETYGFDWCPGDEILLQYVGKNGFRDPACDLKDVAVSESDPHGPKDQRQSPCDLKFGGSTGALGLRKFPNPKFNPGAWKKLNGGSLGTWEGFNKKLSSRAELSDAGVSHLADGSIEPPFLIGMACGACHISFNPANPPEDTANPKWENLLGAIGNQYARFSEIMGSGMPDNSLEWQVFAHARPGTTDTSAVPTDQVNNPGTMNALLNIKQRPVFENEEVIKWRKVSSCEANEPEDTCWCEPGRDNKCWRHGLQKETVHHILKGGGDSTGAHEAVQRVYINIGSCSEECWVNHLTDLRQIDPTQRNFGQTPFDIGQCRRDCANFRAVEDRLPDIVNFLLSGNAGANDLVEARRNQIQKQNANAKYDLDDLVDELNKEFGTNAVERGRVVFLDNCARCHSSTAGDNPAANHDFYKVNAETGQREDWLGNDKPTKVSEVGTYTCRALHSNHMEGHVWQGYGSETYRAKPADDNIREPNGGGRGYYRNISLLNLWAHAPFMHNNAIGPELCGEPGNKQNDFYSSPYVDSNGDLHSNPPACWPYDPSVEGRFKLYKASMKALLNPKDRIAKVTKLNESVPINIGPKIWDGNDEKQLFGLSLEIPAGRDVAMMGNFQHKSFIVDMVRTKTKPKELRANLTERLGDAKASEVIKALEQVAEETIKEPNDFLSAVRKRLPVLLDAYSSCSASVENAGHRFGEDLSNKDKDALTAFLATL